MMTRTKHAFTLVELLVVISIISLLVTLTLPALASARGNARQSVCGSNLHQLGIASNLYLDAYGDQFWRYYWTVPGGVQWWFGYEAGGPGSGANRPLDKSRSIFAPFMSAVDDHFACPSFAYSDSDYFPKFQRPSASYGFNVTLGPASGQARSRKDYWGRESNVFVFADGIHFDFSPGYNEGHYIAYTANTNWKSGYGHFRHKGLAQMVLMDGHVQGQKLRGRGFANGYVIGGGPSGNLTDASGTNAIYGLTN